MNDLIQANYDELEGVAASFNQASEDTQQTLQHILRTLSPLRNGGWQGRGAESFFNEMDTLVLPALRRLVEALSQGQSATRDVHRVMGDAEESASSGFTNSNLGESAAGFSGASGAAPAAGGSSGGSGSGGLDGSLGNAATGSGAGAGNTPLGDSDTGAGRDSSADGSGLFDTDGSSTGTSGGGSGGGSAPSDATTGAGAGAGGGSGPQYASASGSGTPLTADGPTVITANQPSATPNDPSRSGLSVGIAAATPAAALAGKAILDREDKNA